MPQTAAHSLYAALSRPHVAKMGFIGDSRLATSHLLNGLSLPGQGVGYWCEFLSRGRVRCPGELNFAVSGERTDQIITRLPQVLASDADIVGILMSTNDQQQGTPPIADRMANLLQAATDIRTVGKIPLIITELPRTSFSGTPLKEHMRIVNFLRSLAETHGFCVVDVWQELCDPASSVGAPRSGKFYDGLHPAISGSYEIGLAICRVLAVQFPEPFSILPASSADLFDAITPDGSLNSNPMLEGSGGTIGANASGASASNFQLLTSDAAFLAAGSKVTIGSKVWQQIVVSGTPSTNANGYLVGSMSVANLQAGDIVEGVCEVEVDAGAANFYGPYLMLQVTGSTTPAVYAGFASATPDLGPSPAVAHSGIIRTPRLIVPSSPVSTLVRLMWSGKAAAAAAATFRVGRMKFKKIV